MVKKVKIPEHGAEYFKCGKILCGRAMLQNGKIDTGKWEVQEAPKKFKAGHKKALARLGVRSKPKQEEILSSVSYY